MRDTEAASDFAERTRPLTTVDYLLVANVVIAAILFEVWFLLLRPHAAGRRQRVLVASPSAESGDDGPFRIPAHDAFETSMSDDT